MKPADYLSFYATKFKTVEIDSTYYGPPSASTVTNWRDRTPPDFVFSAKVPQSITHDKVLIDCDTEFNQFITTMDILEEKLGPLVFQFPYFDRTSCESQVRTEIRNKTFNAALADLLRKHKIALVLQDSSFRKFGSHNDRRKSVTL